MVMSRDADGSRLALVQIGGALCAQAPYSLQSPWLGSRFPLWRSTLMHFARPSPDIARRMNARAGRWLDRSTRHDGVEVDCGLKMLETKRFLKADPDDM